MNTRFWAAIGIILAVFVGFLIFGQKGGDKSAIQPTNHLRGDTSSKVKLVEYGDFECPVCGLYYPVVEQVIAKYNDKITFQFRHLPLTQIHRNAFAASRAAEAASKQNKFWEMHSLLYQNQNAWSASGASASQLFKQFATDLKLDIPRFERDAASDIVNRTINADIAAFDATKEKKATPTFFLNGKKLEFAELTDDKKQPQLDQFSKLIDAELKKQSEQAKQ